MINYDEFAQLDLRVGIVVAAENVPKSTHLMKLSVDIGEDAPRQIIAGIADKYSAEEMIDRKIIVLTNLQPRKLMGLESQGMLLAADVDDSAVLLKIDDKYLEKIKPGTHVH
jgi:methionine--tRNA ligase beta chain